MLLKTDFHFEKERLHFQVDFFAVCSEEQVKVYWAEVKTSRNLLSHPIVSILTVCEC